MSRHIEEREVERHDSDRVVINSDSESPILETLLLKKGPNGYTIQKGRKNRRSGRNGTAQNHPKTKTSNQPFFYEYVFPDTRNQPYSKSSAFDLNHFTCSSNSCWIQNNSEASTSKDHFEIGLGNAVQDPVIDSSSAEIKDGSIVIEDFDDYKSYRLNPLYDDRTLGGCSLVKKDCFLGGNKTQNLSGLDGFPFSDQGTLFPETMEDSFAEPILEKLFSQVSNASEASTKTIDSDDMNFLVNTDCEDEDEESNINILDDGSIPVISKSDSDVHVVGSL
ncbi:uncharacterized protein LOC117176127 [Belonocnema kinseyi]|uniref:uncharacterized protein LOC117176127 n=1 Tax=Belonocnema kinseyi TaxID=2817044 RepID=UPI00143CFDF4|nr:uncharacterized protein LOC117176127 [Belonocnema kinseyi]